MAQSEKKMKAVKLCAWCTRLPGKTHPADHKYVAGTVFGMTRKAA